MKPLFSACLSLTVLQLEAPAYVKLGDSLTMQCGFHLEGKTLYRYDNQWFCGWELNKKTCGPLAYFHNLDRVGIDSNTN